MTILEITKLLLEQNEKLQRYGYTQVRTLATAMDADPKHPSWELITQSKYNRARRNA